MNVTDMKNAFLENLVKKSYVGDLADLMIMSNQGQVDFEEFTPDSKSEPVSWEPTDYINYKYRCDIYKDDKSLWPMIALTEFGIYRVDYNQDHPYGVSILIHKYETEFNRDDYDELCRIMEEVSNSPEPTLTNDSIEDCDDLYQAKLEWNWWKDEVEAQFKELKDKLGINNNLMFK
jgi:hypothetical protein